MDSKYISDMVDMLLKPMIETLYMVSITTVVSAIFGFGLGVLLYLTQKGGLVKNKQGIYNLVHTKKKVCMKREF